jgi:hypothetical protein
MKKPRLQCAKCPWKVTTDPNDIPNGYCEVKHSKLADTIAKPGALPMGPLRVFACHESSVGRELPCVGWLENQLGEGNNIALRLAVSMGRIDANVRTVGEQHTRFEDTLPKEE